MRRFVVLATAGILFVASAEPARGQETAAEAGTSTTAADRTRQVLEAYWENHDPAFVADDAVFTMMPSGEQIYLMVNVLLQQIGGPPGEPAPN